MASPTTVGYVIWQLRAFRVANERDDVVLCVARRIDDVASEPTTCTEHRDPHALSLAFVIT